MNPSSRRLPWLLALLSGLILWFSWPTYGVTFSIFIAFVPLLVIQDLLEANGRKGYFKYVFTSMLIWNAGTTWWIINSTLGGGIMAVVLNSLLMCIPFALSYKARKVLGFKEGIFAFILFWISFEYIHFNWDLAWPWLTLGHVFADFTGLIQWYEFTGVLGGSLWVLAINFSLYVLLREVSVKKAVSTVCLLFIPMLISWVILSNRSEQFNNPNYEVLAVQPNLDPYTEKFYYSPDFVPYDEQLQLCLKLSDSLKSDDTKLILWPETSVQGKRYEPNLRFDPEVSKVIGTSLKDSIDYLIGVESWVDFPDEETRPDVTKHREDIGYYLNYNTSVLVSGKSMKVYHKSKFVPGVEKVPFPTLLGWVTKIIRFQGAGTYGSDEERKVLFTRDSVGVAPLVCYESVFGEFVGQFVQNGAGIIGVITNDAWWGNTEGHRHHNLYARFRAIELRKPVIRSANTGISSVINPLGEEVIRSNWWEETAVCAKVEPNTEITFYAEYGDVIGRTFAFISVLMIIVVYVQKKTKKV